ncbi:MAG: DUF3382 domain-containing protein, partial [Alphaproteobacteria bacterium]
MARARAASVAFSGIARAAIGEALVAAGVAFMLALPLAGLRLPANPLDTVIFRPWWVVVAVATVFLGRLGLALWRSRPGPARRNGVPLFDRALAYVLPWRRRIFLVFILLVALLPLMPFADRRVIDLGAVVLIYVMLGWGLIIVVGLAGLLV